MAVKTLLLISGFHSPDVVYTNRWEDDVPKLYNEMGILMTQINKMVKDRRPIIYPLDVDGGRVRLK